MVENNGNRFLEEGEENSSVSTDDLMLLFDLSQKEINMLVWLIIDKMSENSTENPEATYKNLILEKKYNEAITFCHSMIEKISEQLDIITESDSNNKKLEKLASTLTEIKESWKNRREVAKTFLERNL